jgi:AraC family transcriptional regulator of adaptative response/methylated-DNA-[protein]-cysteine methyltransferase
MHPTPDLLYTALTKRDPAYDGLAFVGVTSTGIFCRLVCPARTPKFANTRFFETPRACLDAGFRPCLRCRPLAAGIAEPLVKNLLAQLNVAPDRTWSEPDLIAQGLDPSTVRRAFKRHFGLTFLDLARRRRTARGLKSLAAGHPIIEAQMDAGYDSASGFREAINRLIGDTPSHLQSRPPLFADWLETPIGPMLGVADAHALHLLEFVDRKALPTELARLRATTKSAIAFARCAPIAQIDSELAAYFAGTSATFTTPLARHTAGFTAGFTAQVWDALRAIPPATTRAYSELATILGAPTASRAVARANGANQLAIIIPCHRIIGLDGSLTGYAGKLWRKAWLLRHEARHFA